MVDSQTQFARLVVVGVGLIGGSIALAAKTRGIAKEVFGIGRNQERLAAAKERGVIDFYVTELSELSTADLVVICTPVNRIAKDVITALDALPADCLVTDAGSIKESLVHAVEEAQPENGRFLGAHPLAGSHQTGFENADPALYNGRLCVVTPTSTTHPNTVERVEGFWKALGMRVERMSPAEHDRVLAMTSHLPHLAASALAGLVDEEMLSFAASGFRDTTRVAAGDPDLWTAIFSENSRQVVDVTQLLIDKLQLLCDAISSGDQHALRQHLAEAQTLRRRFDQIHSM
ncbi:MAG: prephenate dehydrogenase [Planctomycetaceae bacterium]|nr:prephenate dehydrogenase [Planctomycetaceae bacterium]